MEGERVPPGRRRRRWITGAALGALLTLTLGLSLSYVFLVVRDEPLTRGMVSGPSIGTLVHGQVYPQVDVRVIDYVDGQAFTAELWVHNSGRFGLTVTGVETSDTGWRGLVTLADARPGVITGPAPCCIIDEQATWAPSSFRPTPLDRDKEMGIVLRLVLGHCEDSYVGGAMTLQSVRVHYDVLGNPHTADIAFIDPITVRYTRADQCPRAPTRSGTPLTPPPTR